MAEKAGGNGHKQLIEATRAHEKTSAGGQTIDLETVQIILAQRAARMAQVPEQETEGKRTKLVMVRLGGEIYALDTQFVFDIWPAKQVTFVPRVPKWVLGVVNRRGRILSVVDLREFLGLAKATLQQESNELGWHDDGVEQVLYLILVQVPEMEVVLCVDDVLGVDALLDSRIQEVTGTVRGIPTEYVRGVSEIDKERIRGLAIVLNLKALLADERLVIHQEIG
jgi:purine-binding chemotaxis protein CheW